MANELPGTVPIHFAFSDVGGLLGRHYTLSGPLSGLRRRQFFMGLLEEIYAWERPEFGRGRTSRDHLVAELLRANQTLCAPPLTNCELGELISVAFRMSPDYGRLLFGDDV